MIPKRFIRLNINQFRQLLKVIYNNGKNIKKKPFVGILWN